MVRTEAVFLSNLKSYNCLVLISGKNVIKNGNLGLKLLTKAKLFSLCSFRFKAKILAHCASAAEPESTVMNDDEARAGLSHPYHIKRS